MPLADHFQALADPTRLRILALLRLMELSVGELAQVLGQSQPRVSRHLKILADAGVLERRKEGSWVFLTLAEAERVEPMFALIDRWGDAATQALFASDAARTESVRAERSEAANRYFAGEAPWALAKSDPARQGTVLYVTAEVLRQVAILCQPFIPGSAAKLLDLLGVAADRRAFAQLGDASARIAAGTALPAPAPVFPRYIEPDEAAAKN